MRDTDQRAAAIIRRTLEIRRRQEKRGSAALSAVCCALCICLVGIFRVSAGGGGAGHIPLFFGSALLYGGAGGYVLAGVLAFAAGVVITVICIKLRSRQEKEISEESKEKEQQR